MGGDSFFLSSSSSSFFFFFLVKNNAGFNFVLLQELAFSKHVLPKKARLMFESGENVTPTVQLSSKSRRRRYCQLVRSQ